MPKTVRKTAITQASSGIGAAEMRPFASPGAQVWGTIRDAGGRNASKKAALGAYSPRIAIHQPGKTS